MRVRENTETEQFLTVPEAAELARMSKAWVYRNSTELGGRKRGRYIRFHRETLIQRLRDVDVPPRR